MILVPYIEYKGFAEPLCKILSLVCNVSLVDLYCVRLKEWWHPGVCCHTTHIASCPLFSHLLSILSLSVSGHSSPLGPQDNLTLDNLFKHQAPFCFVFPFLSLLKWNKHHPVPRENISDAALPSLRRKSPEKRGQGEKERSCREACKRELCEGALGAVCSLADSPPPLLPHNIWKQEPHATFSLASHFTLTLLLNRILPPLYSTDSKNDQTEKKICLCSKCASSLKN